VDDEGVIRKVLKFFLRKEWHKRSLKTNRTERLDLLEARYGREAVDIIPNLGTLPDLIITDNEMPIMTGVELSQWVKENHPEIPVILTSGKPEPEEHRADDFVKKPFNLTELKTTIETLLSEEAIEKAR